MPACSFGIWILFLHVNRSIRMKTDENSLYLGPFHRRKPPAENASLHACRAHDNHLPPLAAFVRRQCGGFRRAALRWAGAPGRRRSGALAPLRARCRAKPGSGRVGEAHPPPRRSPIASTAAKKAAKSPAPRSMGPGTPNDGRKGRGNDPAPWGKAAAHALRAAAASSACRGPLSQGNPARCCATIAARVGPRGRCCRWFCR